jgi:hypothetical protein
MMSVLVRNERIKLAANYLNSIASATFVGAWLPLIAAWTLGTGKIGEGTIFLMLFAFFVSGLVFSMAYKTLATLEEPT